MDKRLNDSEASEGRSDLGDVQFWLLSARVLVLGLKRALRPLRLTPDAWLILEGLAPSPRMPTALAKDLGIQKGSMSRWLSRLEACGWVDCRVESIDQRRKTVSLTSSGRQQLDRARETLSEWLAAVDMPAMTADRDSLTALSRCSESVGGQYRHDGAIDAARIRKGN